MSMGSLRALDAGSTWKTKVSLCSVGSSEWLLGINRATTSSTFVLSLVAILYVVHIYIVERNWLTEGEVQLAADRRLKYQGTAKVCLDQIQFDPPLPRDLDQKNLEQLRQLFRKKRCRRLNVENYVPVIVSRRDLTEALKCAGISQASLTISSPNEFPLVQFSPGNLRGLHGRHRIQVGSELLNHIDHWWMVDLYLDGSLLHSTLLIRGAEKLTVSTMPTDMDDELRATLIEDYGNLKTHTDGEIYRKIRLCEDERNEPFRQRWLARLSQNTRCPLEQLDSQKNRRLRNGFDALLTIPGLWGRGMRISLIHRLVAIDCDEVCIHQYGWFFFFASSPLPLILPSPIWYCQRKS